MKLVLARVMFTIMLLWLPLQGYAALSMPFCQDTHHHHAMSGTQDSDGDCCPGEEHDGHHTKALTCDDCSFCHLCTQGALFFNLPPVADNVTKVEPSHSTTAFKLYFPEQPQRPPLARIS